MAIFFGDTLPQEFLLLYRMRNSIQDLCHPLALVGAACELERDRSIKREVRPLESQYMERQDFVAQIANDDLAAAMQKEQVADLLTLHLKCSFLIVNLEASKRQMNRIMEQPIELRASDTMTDVLRKKGLFWNGACGDSGRDNDSIIPELHTEKRLYQRLVQISDEFDHKIDNCRQSMEDTMVTTQLMLSRAALGDTRVTTELSVAMKEDSSQMRWIAFLTMIYLPLTSVATVFSLNVFN
ncbi:hypothetical protein CGCA056_v009944 [Colletotrichum aenigma]|uniref:uncharacterized protein n=1 Tax=Colletotrichum aenigma TaxID=1215731 RepID=UPI0018729A94|nr:uncharacterized protein CGCA056_v009944 [Colletotrichum aenigma]KAF5518768.1 hypothetical protein CGCA056_v009944 [Colletotrichum aenigma]